jgi:aspartate racemase
VLTPDAADRDQVSSIIYNELCHNVIRPESRALYLEVVGRLLAEGVEGIILGCTEVELLIGPEDVTVPVFPTTLLHAQAAIDFALSDR